jgi:hypothetical protein
MNASMTGLDQNPKGTFQASQSLISVGYNIDIANKRSASKRSGIKNDADGQNIIMNYR